MAFFIDSTGFHNANWVDTRLGTIKTNMARDSSTTFKHGRQHRKEASRKKKMNASQVNDIDNYWNEISAKCIDAESIRVQEALLKSAVVLLENVSMQDTASVHVALDNVHLLAKTVAMLKG